MEKVADNNIKVLYAYNSNAQLRCLSCGSPNPVPRERGGYFCRECINRSRMDKLDPLYDDLGGRG